MDQHYIVILYVSEKQFLLWSTLTLSVSDASPESTQVWKFHCFWFWASPTTREKKYINFYLNTN